MATTTVDIGTLISKDPAMHGGKPCIAGTGTTVLAVWDLYLQGLSAEDTVGQYPALSLAGVFAALAYATANAEEIESLLQEDEDAYVEWEREEGLRRARLARASK